MLVIYLLIGCLIIIGFLGILLLRKQKIDHSELNEYKNKLVEVKEEYQDESKKLESTQKDLEQVSYTLKC